MKKTTRTIHTRLPIQLAALAAGLLAWAAASAGGDGPCASPRDPGFIADNGGYEGIFGGGRGSRGPRGNSIVADNGGYESIYGQSGRPCR